MIGDKLEITDYHRSAAAKIFERLKELLSITESILVVSIAGESGSGKSETAAVLGELCEAEGYKALILQQDDYFRLPPKTNHQKRLSDINWVGPGEVKLELLEANINTIKKKLSPTITKPLVNYEQDFITEVVIPVEGVNVLIAEGTYTTLLKSTDLKVFIDLTFYQTKVARLKRNRDPASDFIEKVLTIEHEIIANHKQFAHIIIPPPADGSDH